MPFWDDLLSRVGFKQDGKDYFPASLVGGVELAHTSPAIGNASTLALAANPDREYLLLVNDSDSVMYVSVAQAAVVNRGVRIGANGGSWEMGVALGNLDKRAIYAIHGGIGDKVLLVTEGESNV